MRDMLLIVAGVFVGALITLIVRSALYKPYDHKAAPSALETATHAVHDEHVTHTSHNEAQKPVNTICAICGMDVDSSIPFSTYEGKVIGFGCLKCPPKFAKEPDKYGPYFLRNEVAPK